jgi:hypothetical protein
LLETETAAMRKLTVAVLVGWLVAQVLPAVAATEGDQSEPRSNDQGEGYCNKKKEAPTS